MNDGSKVYINRTFDCSANTLFDWLTKPERIAKWFGPEGLTVGEARNELVEGGDYSIELRKTDKSSFSIKGKYLKIRKPEILNFTYFYEGLVNPPPPSVVRILLKQLNEENTSMTFIQEFKEPTLDMSSRSNAWNYMFGLLENHVINKTVS